MLNIFIDADGCPVIEATVSIAEHFSIPVTIVSDTAHFYNYDNCDIIMVDQGKDAVDFAILQKIRNNDIVVTQDYGLASLVLSKQAFAIHQNGLVYTNENIIPLLNQRYDAAKLRKKNHRYAHHKKRTWQDDEQYMDALERLINQIMEDTYGR